LFSKKFLSGHYINDNFGCQLLHLKFKKKVASQKFLQQTQLAKQATFLLLMKH